MCVRASTHLCLYALTLSACRSTDFYGKKKVYINEIKWSISNECVYTNEGKSKKQKKKNCVKFNKTKKFFFVEFYVLNQHAKGEKGLKTETIFADRNSRHSHITFSRIYAWTHQIAIESDKIFATLAVTSHYHFNSTISADYNILTTEYFF